MYMSVSEILLTVYADVQLFLLMTLLYMKRYYHIKYNKQMYNKQNCSLNIQRKEDVKFECCSVVFTQ